MATKTRMRSALLAACLTLTAPAYAETQADCEKKIPRQTNIAAGVGGGTLAGKLIGMTACTGTLGVAFADLGLTFVACVAYVTFWGTLIGTAVAEASNNSALDQCIKLAENKRSPPTPSAVTSPTAEPSSSSAN